MRKPSINDIKKGMENVRAVHACASCAGHLEAIKEHQRREHKD